jgi:hypothetical protein
MGLSECAMTRRARRAKPHPAFSASRSTSDRTAIGEEVTPLDALDAIAEGVVVEGPYPAGATTADHHFGNLGEHLVELFDDQQHVLMAHVMELDVGTDAIGIDVRLNSAA